MALQTNINKRERMRSDALRKSTKLNLSQTLTVSLLVQTKLNGVSIVCANVGLFHSPAIQNTSPASTFQSVVKLVRTRPMLARLFRKCVLCANVGKIVEKANF